jgi:ABC-2 type transport system permease protein
MSTTAPSPTMSAVRALPFDAARARGRMLANEAGKGLRLLWTYRATLIPSIFSMVVMYLAFQYFVGGGGIVDGLVADTAPAMFAFVVVYLATLRLVAGILEERNAGTLEQIHLSPLPAWQLALGRLASVLTEALLVAVAVTTIVLVAVGVDYPLGPAALLPLGLTVVGAAGFALLIGAASFTYPGIGALVHIIQMAVMMVNGAVTPPELFPRGLEVVAKLAPTTLGAGATRKMLVDGDGLDDVWTSGTLGWLLLHTAVLVVAGWAAYQWQVRRALRDGRLGPA